MSPSMAKKIYFNLLLSCIKKFLNWLVSGIMEYSSSIPAFFVTASVDFCARLGACKDLFLSRFSIKSSSR